MEVLKLSPDTSKGKLKTTKQKQRESQKVYDFLGRQKQQHKEYIDELWENNELLSEKLMNLEDRSHHDNLRLNGMDETGTKTWE